MRKELSTLQSSSLAIFVKILLCRMEKIERRIYEVVNRLSLHAEWPI